MSKFVQVPSMPNETKNGTFQEIGYIELEKPIVIERIPVSTWKAAGSNKVNEFPKLKVMGFKDHNGVEWIMDSIDQRRGTISFAKKADVVMGG